MYYIYKITNKKTQMCYIGLTNNIARRRNRHFTDLRCRRHDNKFLQKHFDRDGEENFIFEVIFEGDVTEQEIGEKEKEYIKKYDSYFNGYNQNEGGNFGTSNGGTQFTKSDIYNICAALEFMSRPGGVLSRIYEVSLTTISRIKHKVNHNEAIEEYDALPLEERKKIYDTFCESTSFLEQKAAANKIISKRKLTREQVLLIITNEKFGRPVTQTRLMEAFGIKSSNTIKTIMNRGSYSDYWLEYDKMTKDQKEELVSLLREQYC